MDWQDFRVHQRLNLDASVIEGVYSTISEIDTVKQSWHLTGKLLPQTIERIWTHPVCKGQFLFDCRISCIRISGL